jgi:pimeloyl-ACP methyl ester carboxylesterase
MATFVLVHGAWHGGWCWGAITDGLAAAGHGSITVDLPCDDPRAGWATYRDVALATVDGVDDDIIVVGHSLGGCVVPLVAAERDVAKIVLLCSFPPAPGQSLDDAVADAPGLTDERAAIWRTSRDALERHVWPDFKAAVYAMYHDCDPLDARSAFDRLRPQAHAPFAEPWPLKRWPDVAIESIVCSDDRMGSPIVLALAARERFGIEPVELPGGHSPFLSQPEALTRTLVAMAA